MKTAALSLSEGTKTHVSLYQSEAVSLGFCLYKGSLYQSGAVSLGFSRYNGSLFRVGQ